MADSIKISRKPKRSLVPVYAGCVLILVAVVAVVGAYLWFNGSVNSPAGSNATPLELHVTAGQTLSDIAPLIRAAGGINSLEVFKIYVRLHNVNVPLQVGTYEVPLNATIPDLIAALQKGPVLKSVTVTIREGLRMDEIADAIAVVFKDVKHPAFTRDDFISVVTNPDSQKFSGGVQQFLNTYKPAGKPLEGFLFPDTYNFGTDASALDVVNLMIGNMVTRMQEKNIDPATPGAVGSFYNVLIYASDVEKEAFDLPEKKMVADIFIRRVTQGYGLASDATILYPFNRWSPPPTAIELAQDTPYNTRLHFGLIPTPICSPGLDSITAVLNPAPNDYYYFLHDPKGGIHYARTLAEHEQNVATYLSGN